MAAAWQLVPRYHPQIRARDVLGALCRSGHPPVELRICDKPQGPGPALLYLDSATAAIQVALTALDLPPDSGVAVPIYCCATVFQAIAEAGHHCVFVDVEPDTFGFDMDSLHARREEISAVVSVSTFGFPADLAAVRGIVPDRPIIEDAAHALGSVDEQGTPVGLRGAAGAFSFSLQKPVSAGAGGLLAVTDPRLLSPVRRIVDRLGPPRRRPGAAALLRRTLKVWLYRPPWYGLLTGSAGTRRAAPEDELSRRDLGRMSDLDRALIHAGLERMPARMAGRRAWARRLCEASGFMEPASTFQRLGEAWNGYLWPVLLKDAAAREESIAYFRRRGVDAFVLWRLCAELAARYYGYEPGACPRLEDALRRLLMLPCYAELTAARKGRIEQAVREWPRHVPLSP
jgi:perosamine synthetase